MQSSRAFEGADTHSRDAVREGAPTHLVVAYDFSPSADLAVDRALDAAAQALALATVHVIWTDTSLATFRMTDEEWQKEKLTAAARLERQLEVVEKARRLRGEPTTVAAIQLHVGRASNPADDIVALCHDVRAQLLLVGGNNRSKLGRFLLGSVSEEVSRRAPCSVLLARSDQYEATAAGFPDDEETRPSSA